jgi:rhamnosyltransferase
MKSKVKISIIIRTFNEENHIEKLLRRIFQQEIDEPFEVIIVDSGSDDRTLDIARRYPVFIETIKSSDFSFGRSLNVGIKKSSGNFLVFISAHCYPSNKVWLKNLLLPFKDNKVALVYGRQRGNKVTKFSEMQIFLKLFPDTSNLKQTQPYCNNANSAIRKSLWRRTPFNEELTGLEDLDWSVNVIKLGYYLSYNSKASIVHIHDENYWKIYKRYEREALAFKNIFPETNFNFIDFLSMFISNTFVDCIRFLKAGIFVDSILEIPKFRLMQFWGTYKGYNIKNEKVNDLKQYYYSPRPIGFGINKFLDILLKPLGKI